jgi:lipopolysaccharide transport system ATP-binding protein
MLSRITAPSSGSFEIFGSLAALLEVGTGFHPELSGRENIYLNATILGLSRAQIKSKFDEIVEFAEVHDFIDVPVKHYSSGMFMRLAFAISAHLEPDILLLDEVLAVGDAKFQKKCLSKMESVAKGGRTILFVSHSLPSIIAFCDRCILLENGTISMDGPTREVADYYQQSLSKAGNESTEILEAVKTKTNKAYFSEIKLIPIDREGCTQKVMRVGYDLKIEISFVANKKIVDNNIAVVISDFFGYRLIDVNLSLKNESVTLLPGQEASIQFILKNLLLRPGSYRINLWAGRRAIEDTDLVSNAATLDVEINTETIDSFMVFDGVYQCEFLSRVSYS